MTTVVWESHCRTHSCWICGTVYSNLILKCIVSLAKVHFLNVTSSFSFFISRHKKFHRILFRFFIIKKHVHLFSWLPFLVTSVQTLLKEAALSAFVYFFNSFLGPALFMMKTVRFTFFTSKYIERVGSEYKWTSFADDTEAQENNQFFCEPWKALSSTFKTKQFKGFRKHPFVIQEFRRLQCLEKSLNFDYRNACLVQNVFI